MEVKQEIVEAINGQKVEKYTIVNDNGVQVDLLTLGATWQEFLMPGDKGGQENLIVGFDKPSDYLESPLCAGQSVGRIAGRINQGKINPGGREIQLPRNEKGNTLHSGSQGFHQQIWAAFIEAGQNAFGVAITYDAKEEIDHFPGDVQVEVRFTLDNANRFMIVYTGKNATKTTFFSPTNRVYFNLRNRQDLNQHTFTLTADHYLETRDDSISTGEFIDVAGMAYDFQTRQNLGEIIADTGGLGDAFLVNAPLDKTCRKLKDDEGGDSVHLYSDRDTWVVYSMGGIPEGIYPARDKGRMVKEFEALAFEAQFLPDAINHDNFGDITLQANEEKSYTITFEYHKEQYRFTNSVKKEISVWNLFL